jgi:multiple sugar transport system permease protein
MRHVYVTRRRRDWLAEITYVVAAVAAIAFVVAPMVWALSSSVQDEAALQRIPPFFIPRLDILTRSHYHFIFTGEVMPGSSVMIQAIYTMHGVQILPSVVNSLIVAVIVVAANLALGAPAAHALARLPFRGSHSLLLLMLATRLLPAISIAIPVYIIVRSLGLLDTKLALVLVYTAITLPFTIWLLRAYFMTVDPEIEDSARLDGCTRLQSLLTVVVPLAKPGLIATAAFAFMYAYGEFIFALVLTQTIQSQTQNVVIASLAAGMSTSRGLMAASAVVASLPPVIVALIFRRQIIEGLTAQWQSQT